MHKLALGDPVVPLNCMNSTTAKLPVDKKKLIIHLIGF